MFSIRSLVCAVVCALPLLVVGPESAQAQSIPFYTNTDMTTTQNVAISPGRTSEIVDDIPFTGTYRVDRFVIGYNLTRFTPTQFRNISVDFYQPDPVTGFPSVIWPVTQIELSNVNVGRFVTEDIDLAAMSQSFLWTAGSTFGGEQGGLLGLEFDPNSSGNWYFADGGGSSNTYDERSYSNFAGGFPYTDPQSDLLTTYFFGPGLPFEGSFYAVIYGEAVPEPSACALLAGLSVTGMGFLTRRQRVLKK